ncbi:TPA: 30S ribosomal protein S5 [Candidatus Uhrbacteria bacterium]|nr:30S ribosomal protein S5 [Candidatus Uhrbacteria bacterium]
MDNKQQNNAPSEGQQRPGSPAGRGGRPSGGRPPRNRRSEEKGEFDSRILELARVTRVTKGGKRMRFRACVVLGDRKGRVGYGVAKGLDVQQAVSKATNKAKKVMITVPFVNETIPYEIRRKFAAAQVIIKPAPEGTGVKAGGAVRVVLELAGVPNVVAKILGSNNKINNAKATMAALSSIKTIKERPNSAKKSKLEQGVVPTVESQVEEAE